MELWEALGGEDKRAQMDALLEVLASFIFEPVGDRPFSSGLVHFLAVLGIDAEMDRLREAKHYSYMLAGIVYYVQVLGVEKLLPAARRDEQTNEDREHFLLIRRRFLADGSYSPISEMISLLAYRKFVALNAGNAGNAYWSKDKTIFYLHGRLIVINRFRRQPGRGPKITTMRHRNGVLQDRNIFVADGQEYLAVEVLGGGFHDYVWADEQGP
ncbi:hypothetical protein K491DRAFT_723842 [Lophiostoma macrostomum CBS 122681]|uniref:Uncharacterized protein n=1 Tax=Lophiostoma macrostomum CBS 122681 TaxID=1314788 RepID=A0A6A6SGT1_9PLEO|nr:hypothetical protein K491DRAFT_723842 [Lophiostoma macrostomum CBS 122681]